MVSIAWNIPACEPAEMVIFELVILRSYASGAVIDALYTNCIALGADAFVIFSLLLKPLPII